jgi:hypothetical protein
MMRRIPGRVVLPGSAHPFPALKRDHSPAEGKMVIFAADEESIRRARSAVETTWRSVAELYTFGWSDRAEDFEDRHPFITRGIRDIRRTITPGLPLLSYRGRERPSPRTVVAVPHEDPDGSLCDCRLLFTDEPPAGHPGLLNAFSQTFWFLIAAGSLPSPRDGDALRRRVVEWTGPGFVEP